MLLCLTGLGCDAIDWSRLRGANQSPEEVAIAFVTALSEHDIDTAANMFSAEIYDAMSVEQVREIWPRLLAEFGAFVQFGDVTTVESESKYIVTIPCVFEEGTARFQVIVDDGIVAGFVRQYGASESE